MVGKIPRVRFHPSSPSNLGPHRSKVFKSRQDPYPTSSAYPDSWVAENDTAHGLRVSLLKNRRGSVPSSVESDEDDEDESFRNAPWRRDRRSSVARSTDNETSSNSDGLVQSMLEELRRYNDAAKSISDNEWVHPPRPRSRARRLDPVQYSKERVQELKRWSQAQAFMYGQTTSSLRSTDTKHPRSAYVPGTVFSAPFHTSSSSDEMYVQADDPNLTATPFGTVCSKYRKMIVIRVYGEHCTCLPIYTHNGRGLDSKEFPKEFVSIRDVAEKWPEPYEGPHPGILAIRDQEFRAGSFITGRSVVKLTESISHRFDAPATIEGRLDSESESRQRLFELIKLVDG
ncbi:hypothetical protein GGS23DRAFT_617368 [Durotheca rogersii]|uniref:uncharacterized protein n=1 Tax=Durotheca rogersii TaxID=419775 RepID=UPI0022212351|nr:uncharacterized protein GGS23DRAFT_617368 [Durotheca rogersii]KAI5866305.1 hypothetical protein GGS23DRAFT_617368 [Durotheca rogersii]